MTPHGTWVCSGTSVPSTRTPAIPIRMTCSRRAWRRATFGTQVPSRSCGRHLNSCDPTVWLVAFTTRRCSCYLLFCGHVRAMCVLLPAPRDTARQHQQKSPTWESSVLAHPCHRGNSVSPGCTHACRRHQTGITSHSLPATAFAVRKRCADAGRSHTVRVHPSVSGSRSVRRQGPHLVVLIRQHESDGLFNVLTVGRAWTAGRSTIACRGSRRP